MAGAFGILLKAGLDVGDSSKIYKDMAKLEGILAKTPLKLGVEIDAAKLKTLKESVTMKDGNVTNIFKTLEIDANRYATQTIDASGKVTTKIIEDTKKMLNAEQKLQLFREESARKVQMLTSGNLKGLYDSTALKKYENSVRGLSSTSSNLDFEMKKLSSEFKNIEVNAKSSAKAIDITNSHAESLGTTIKKTFEKFALWMGVTTIFFGGIQQIRNMATAVIELDDAVLEMSKVTSLGKDSLMEFSAQAAQVGKQVNASAAQVVNASADFARMGFSPEDSLNLANQALILTKIADGITEVDEATTSLIGILKGFNLEASNTSHIIDAINEVSNRYAINTDDLAEGLRRTAGVLGESNTSFEETIGLLTAGQESLQNIEKVSSGLITISTRLRGVSESGEEIDGLMPKLQKAFKDFADIDIQTQNGELRSTSDILVDLSKKWGDLNGEQRSYLGFLTAGTRQSPVLNAIMGNLSTTIGATSDAYNSAGSAQEEFRKVTESLTGKLDYLSATWTRVANDFISSAFLSGVLDIAKGFSSVVESVKLLNIALLVTVGILSSKGLTPGFTGLTIALGRYATAAGLSATATTALASAFSILAPVAAVGIFLGLVKIADSLVTTQAEWNEKIGESTSRIADLESKIKSYGENIDNLTESEKKYIEILNERLTLEEQQNKQLREEAARDYLKSLESQILTIEEYGDRARKSLANPYNTSALLNYTFALEDLKNGLIKDSEFTGFKIILAEQYEELKKVEETLGSLPPELRNYAREIEKALGIETEANNKATDAWSRHYQALGEAKKQTKEIATGNYELRDSTFSIVDAIDEYNANGKELSENTIAKMIRNQELLNFAMKGSKEDVVAYAKQWGLTTNDVIDFQQAMVNAMLKGAQHRLDILLKEREALNAYVATDDFLFFGDPRKVTEAGEKISDEILEIRDSLKKYELAQVNADKVSEYFTKTVKSQTNALVDQQKAFGDIAEMYAESLNNLLETTVKMIKQENENYKDQLSIKKEIIDLAEKERDYAKDVEGSQKNITSIQNKLLELSLDNSREGNVERLKLEEELKDEQLKLEEINRDRSVELQKDALDKEIDKVEQYLSQEGKLREDALERLNKAYTDKNSTLMAELIKWNNIYGTGIENDIVTAWDKATLAVSKYKSALGGGTFSGAISASSDASVIAKMRANSLSWFEADAATRLQLESENVNLSKELSFGVEKVNGRWLNSTTKVPIYGNGGYVDTPHMAIVGDEKESIVPDAIMPDFIARASRMVMASMEGKSTNLGGIQINMNGFTVDSSARANELADLVIKRINNATKRNGQANII